MSGNSVSFNGSGSSDPDGTIAKYEWDFDGNGSYETNTGATATTTKSFPTAGNVTVGLRVTDNIGGTAHDDARPDRLEPRAHGLLHRHAQPGADRHRSDLQRRRLLGPRRHDRQIRVGPRRQRQL